MKKRFTNHLLEEKWLYELYNQVDNRNSYGYLTKLDNILALVYIWDQEWD
jgi:hypothetical protein